MMRSILRKLFFSLVLLAVVVGGTPVTAQTAMSRIDSTVRSAVALAPEMAYAVAESDAHTAASQAETAALAPYVEWQSEGFGSEFDRRPNAQDTLRVGTPFEAPWNLSRRRTFENSLAEVSSTSRSFAAARYAWSIGDRWLRAAAVVEEMHLLETRARWLEKALEIQARRLELGEVSGSEVMQFRLLLADVKGAEADARGRWASAWALLSTAGGDAAQKPLPGDLKKLAETLTSRTSEPGFSAELLAAKTDAVSAASRADWLAAAAWGRPSIELEWERFPSIEGIPGYDAWGFRINVPLPLGGTGARVRDHALAEARMKDATVREIERTYEARSAALEARQAAALANLEELSPLVDELDRAEISLTEQYRLGELNYTGLVDGLDRLDRTRHRMLAVLLELATSRYEAQWISGGPAWFQTTVSDQEDK